MPARSSRLLGGGLVLLVAAIGLFFALSRPTPVPPADGETGGPAWFADVTSEVGLDFVHDPGPVGHFFMPQIMGAGAALFDFDNDGRLDIYLLQSGGPDSRSTNRLYRQGPDGRFTDVSQGSNLDIAGYCTGVAVGDVNNDGRPDVLVTQFGGLKLFLNDGGGTFTEAGPGAGLNSVLWGTSAAFLDYDRDGWLDLVVVNYVQYDPSVPCHDRQGRRDYCHPRQFRGSVTSLYRNLGPQGPTGKDGRPGVRFEDMTEKAGLSRLTGPGLGVASADFNGDGWPDIFVANDGRPNHLWVNQGNGTFQEEAVDRGLAYDGMGQAPANMGVALGDVDGNGLFDVFVTHLTNETHTLWCQEPRGMFRDRTVRSGLAPPGSRGTGFGTVMADFDHDGELDVVAVNGRVARGSPVAEETLGPFWSQYAERNQLFANAGAGRFRDISSRDRALCGAPGVYRGLACGDVDGDGALDLLVTSLGGPVRLFRNVAPDRGHGLLVRAIDPALQRDAYGAEVTVRAGGRRWVRSTNPGYSYLCSNDPRAHFGLGGVAHIDGIDVLWPDGTRETFPGGPADQRPELVLRKGTGRPVR
ncbi:MAG TPA: CRTAC1 family protein [Gemmataceae bacterium]|nr:CRTAC1 family protein [Gemmataceae bacterium]